MVPQEVEASSYVDPSYQRMMKEALAIQKEWKRMIITNFICAGFALVIGLCIVRLLGELGLFVAIPLLTPMTIYLLLDGLRLLLQGDPLNEFLNLRQTRRRKQAHKGAGISYPKRKS